MRPRVGAVTGAWDQDGFRARVQAALDAFLDEQAERLAPLGPDAARLVAEARTSVAGGKMFRASFCWWGHLAVAPPADERRAGPGLRLAGAAARQRPRARRLHGRLRQPPGPAVDAPHLRARAPRRGVARRPGAVRRVRRDPPRRPAAVVVRRAAAPLRAAAGGRGPGPRRLRPVPHRGDRRPVPRRLRPGPRPRRRRHRDDGAALQVGQVLHRAAPPPRRRPRRRARRRRWPS